MNLQMNLLIVDDQKDVADNLKDGIVWGKLNIDQVYTAYNARQARLLLVSSNIDILLTDIEMPQEDGLQLFQWAKKAIEGLECIFLTSHADFEYAQKAIKLGGFDYILQPAKYAEVEQVVKRACDQIQRSRKYKSLEKISGAVSEHQSDIIDHAVRKYIDGSREEAIEELANFNIIDAEAAGPNYLAGIQVTSLLKNKNQWDTPLMHLVFHNILDELFQEIDCKIVLGSVWGDEQVPGFFGLVFTRTREVLDESIYNVFQSFFNYISHNTEFEIALYTGACEPGYLEDTADRLNHLKADNIMKVSVIMDVRDSVKKTRDLEQNLSERWINMFKRKDYILVEQDIDLLLHRLQREGALDIEMMKNLHYHFMKALNVTTGVEHGSPLYNKMIKEMGYEEFLNIYQSYETFMKGVRECMQLMAQVQSSEESSGSSIDKALQYIRKNIHKNLTRTEVAQYVYLNEDYFSRAFRLKTGKSFKDYLTDAKIQYARELLETTKFSVSIVASKVGYDNFSYFSKVFKKYVNMTPQEYRNNYHKQ